MPVTGISAQRCRPGVYAGSRPPTPSIIGEPGSIVTEREFVAWLEKRVEEDQRLRDLQRQQKGVFPRK